MAVVSPCPPGSRCAVSTAPDSSCRWLQVRSSSSRGMTRSPSACATSTGTPERRPGSMGTPASKGSVPQQDRRPRPSPRVGEQQPASERRTAAEADEQHPTSGRGGVEPGAEPGHRLGERLGDGSADAAVGEPGVAAPLSDRRPHRGVGEVLREVVGEGRDLLLVRPAAVQEDDERRVRVGRSSTGGHGLAERRHRGSSSTTRPAVRRPPQRRTSPARSSGATGAAFSNSPQDSRGSIHITSNSLPSGSTP